MRTSLLVGVTAVIVANSWILPEGALAQSVSARVFEGIDVGQSELRISFTVPIRYLRHTPRLRGDSIHIQFFPLGVAPSEAPEFFERESLQIPPGISLPVTEITYEGVVAGRPSLDVRLARPMSFEVRQGKDLRSLVVAFPLDPTAARTAGTGSGVAPAPSDERIAEMMEEGRHAMTAGEYDRAAHIFTKVLSIPEHAESPAAQEFLGLARERKRQLAHAKAEYEVYLERYPDGEGADRVRQRLDALITARSEPIEKKRLDPPEIKPLDLRIFGSSYLGYRRATLFPDAEASILSDSSLFTDYHLEARLLTERHTLRAQATGGYHHDFLDGGSGETRTSSLFIEAEDHELGLTGSIGRRSLSTAGVLGRFDGIQLSYDASDRWSLGFAGGFPVESSNQNWINTDRYFAGVSLDAANFVENVDAQVYAITQMEEGMTDRIAVGCEFRYFEQGRFLVGFLDYDVYFQELNLAQLIGNWQVAPSTLLTTFLSHRTVPTLMMQNALQGQVADKISDLLDSFSQSELKQLAKDRTARSTTLNFGVNQDLDHRFQLSADFSATNYSGTGDSEGVAGSDGTGFEFAYGAQLIWNDFLKPSGVSVFGLRFFDGSRNDLLTATLDGRYPITRALRANPRLRADYRMDEGSGDNLLLLPSLRFDYRIWKLSFDAQIAGEWRLPLGSGVGGERWGYSMAFGVRHDY